VRASLEGPIAKLTRAERQLEVLEQQVGGIWPPTKAWPVRTEVDRAGLEYRFYLGELPSIEPDWALLAGEIMFNLRSALDHLVFQLHVRHYRGTVPEDVESTSQFPIFYDPADFRRYGSRRIKKLGEREGRAIRWLQPYVRREDKWRWVRHDLEDLDTFHNIDKHRKLHLVTGSHGAAVVPGFQPDTGFQLHPIWGRVKSHDHVETWTFTKPPAEMQHHSGAYLQIAMEHRNFSFELFPLLHGMTNGVAETLRRFADCFPPVAPAADSAYGTEFWTTRL